jgi:pyridoxine/pyridoxamine 5'-phosphate oxidase
MNVKILKKAIALAEKAGSIFIATVDAHGVPHIAAATKADLTPEGRVAITEWFCPGTIANLQQNFHVSLVIWDKENDSGYQLLGDIENVEDICMLNGYDPKTEGKSAIPQVERRVIVNINKVIDFTHAPHTDREE